MNYRPMILVHIHNISFYEYSICMYIYPFRRRFFQKQLEGVYLVNSCCLNLNLVMVCSINVVPQVKWLIKFLNDHLLQKHLQCGQK